MSQPRTLHRAVGAITRQALGRRRTQLAALLAQWPLIAGPELAAKAVPQRMAPARPGTDGGELTLRVDPADALELQHEGPRLIERLNGHFGFRAVGRIRLVPGRISRPRAATPVRPLTAEQEARLDATLAGIDQPELRERLDALGRAVLGSSRARMPR
ncbi:MAG: DUF721 domain-containing protein [Rhodospirillaceae bacterium]|nr:DUF721 domain-containing protein [Rhodospirillaceae bacterium]